MRGSKDNVTMKTIAEEAGVTLTTVSRILNNKGGKYAEETKQKIFDIADRLKYRPNALVRGMQTGKTGTAGVMIPTSSPFYCQIISGIHEAFIDNETIMLLSWNNRSLNKEDEELERQIIHQMTDRRVEGIILRPSSEKFQSSYFEEIWERDIPLIVVDRELSQVDSDFVGTDDILGGKMAAKHFIDLGHKRLLFIGASSAVSTSRYREQGFYDVINDTPGVSGESINVNVSSPRRDQDLSQEHTNGATSHFMENPQALWEELHQKIATDDRPTAIFCYNDRIAREVVNAIQENGLTVPKDISLIGFGNIESINNSIPLTSFEQHPVQIGLTAAKLYLDRVSGEGPSEVRKELIPPKLIIRDTTRPLQ